MRKAITRQQKTGYYVTSGTSGCGYLDAEGHSWFSKDVARQIARETGGWYEQGNRTTIKIVVTGYTEES